jgi:hypothetical protein
MKNELAELMEGLMMIETEDRLEMVSLSTEQVMSLCRDTPDPVPGGGGDPDLGTTITLPWKR